MTLDELINLRDILLWGKGKVMTDGMYKNIENGLTILNREIKLKTHNFQTNRPILDLDALARKKI